MLEDLTPEFLDEKIALLDPADLYPLRLTGPRLEQKSRAVFSTAG